MSNKLPCGFADSYSQSDSAAAAEQEKQEEAGKSEEDVSDDLVGGSGPSINCWNAEVTGGGVRSDDDSGVVEEDEASKGEGNDDSNG